MLSFRFGMAFLFLYSHYNKQLLTDTIRLFNNVIGIFSIMLYLVFHDIAIFIPLSLLK